MYTGHVQANLMDCLELLRVALYFNVNTPCLYMVSKAMTVSSYHSIMTYALQWQLDELLEVCIEDHAINIVHYPRFSSLPFSVVTAFVKSPYLEVKELELFLAVVEWHKLQKITISNDDIKLLFQQIRYPLIQKNDLVEKVHPTNMADPDLYKAALEYHDTEKFDGPEYQLKLRRFYFAFSPDLEDDEESLNIECTEKGTVITNTDDYYYAGGTSCFAAIYFRNNKPVNFMVTLTSLSRTQPCLMLRCRDHSRHIEETVCMIPLGEEVQGIIIKNGRNFSAVVGYIYLMTKIKIVVISAYNYIRDIEYAS